METYILLFVIVSFFVLYRALEFLFAGRITRYVDKIPGPIKLPFFGTTWLLLLVPKWALFVMLKTRLRRYGTIVRTWLGSEPVVHCIEPQNVEILLNNSVHISKSRMYSVLHPWLGEGLLTSTGQKWHKHRKFITPTFHFKILENFMEIFVEKSQRLVQQLRPNANGDVFDLYPYITRCTLDIICETSMGVKINAMDDLENEYVKSIYGISKTTMHRIIAPWLHSNFIFNIIYGKSYKKHLNTLHNFTKGVIRDRRITYSNNTVKSKEIDDEIGLKKRQALLDMFIDLSNKENAFTDEEIREQVDTFIFEGHDTTTAAISWTLFLLGNHQDIQEKVYEEISEVFQNTNKIDLTNMKELKLLERCCKEALRMYPSVPFLGRQLTQDIELDGYLIPAGCTVSVQIVSLHRNPEIYPNPDVFDPDRFLPENTKDRHPYAYVPFSAGPRNCIGQRFAMYEEKTILSYILKNYRVVSTQTERTIKPMMELVLRPGKGLLVKLEPRTK